MSLSLRLASLEKRLNPVGSSSGAIEQQPCGLCGRQFAKYTCPTCNTPYCSLTCFRSEAHAQCTEPFYRKSLEDEIQAGPSRTPAEKRAMLEMLKRFEEQGEEQGEAGGSDDEEEEEEADELAEKLQGLDLDSADPEALWKVLTPEQQNEFNRMLQDPNGDLVRALLSSEEMQQDVVLPWWEAALPEEEYKDERELYSGGRPRYGHPPRMMDIPESLVQKQKTGTILVYNVLAIAMVYSFVTRRMVMSPLSSTPEEYPEPGTDDAEAEVRKRILHLLPFLADRKSTLVFTSVDSVLTNLWSRVEPDEATPVLFSSLLQSAASLLRPHSVAVLPATTGAVPPEPYSSHPCRTTLLMLSDLHALMRDARKAVARKLQFYGAHIAANQPELLETVAQQAEQAAEEQDRRANPVDKPNLAPGESLRLTTKELSQIG